MALKIGELVEQLPLLGSCADSALESDNVTCVSLQASRYGTNPCKKRPPQVNGASGSPKVNPSGGAAAGKSEEVLAGVMHRGSVPSARVPKLHWP